MTLVWDIEFPTQAQKLIALKLADYAADAGGSVFPSRETLAEKVGCGESTVKRTLKVFRDCGLLHLIREGGSGPKDTNEWSLNVAMLRALASGVCKLVGGSESVEIEGDVAAYEPPEMKGAIKGVILDPMLSTRGPSEPLRGPPVPPKGSASGPQSVTNHQIDSSLCAGARESVECALAPPAQVVAVFIVREGELAWSSWLEAMTPEQRQDAIQAGEIETSSRWASNGRVLKIPKPKVLSEKSVRMMGDSQ